MLFVFFDIQSIKDTPCQDKKLLIEKMDRIYNFSKIIFIVSIILSVITIIGVIIYIILLKRKSPEIEQQQYEQTIDNFSDQERSEQLRRSPEVGLPHLMNLSDQEQLNLIETSEVQQNIVQ